MTAEVLRAYSCNLHTDGADIRSLGLDALSAGLHGAMMQSIDSRYVAYLHSQSFNPCSQAILLDRRKPQLVWRISTLTNVAYEEMLKPLLDLDSIYVRNAATNFALKDPQVETLDLAMLSSLIYDSHPQKIKLDFLTPTSFRSGGNYVFAPTVRLIFQNLLMRYGYIYEGDKEPDTDTINFIEAQTRISSYKLRSVYVSPSGKGAKIPAFMGSITVDTRGPQLLRGMIHMLLSFGEYSGIGIKTSMGMGAVRCTPIGPRQAS